MRFPTSHVTFHTIRITFRRPIPSQQIITRMAAVVTLVFAFAVVAAPTTAWAKSGSFVYDQQELQVDLPVSEAHGSDFHQAAKTGSFVYDQRDLLSDSDFAELEAKGRDYAERYNMGVYLLTCSDMGSYDPSPSERNEFARDFFEQHDLGVGEDEDGIIFVIAADSRDYVTVKHIGSGDDPFSDDCVDELEDDVVDHLSDDDWSGGAQAYYETVGSQLEYFANNGKAWRRTDTSGLLLKVAFTVGVPLVAAITVVDAEKRAMKTARMQTSAEAYEDGALQLDVSRDIFTHRTHTKTPKHDDDDSGSRGGWSSMGGGFSGSGGGKF